MGVVVCSRSYPDGLGRVSQRLGDAEITAVDHSFLGGSLYKIHVVATMAGLETLRKGLREKYGPPVVNSSSVVVTLGGQTVPQSVETWRVGGGEAELKAPSLRIDRLTLTISSTSAVAKINAFRKASGADTF
jgi:hypothetical protein